jgi:hypothetical protein
MGESHGADQNPAGPTAGKDRVVTRGQVYFVVSTGIVVVLVLALMSFLVLTVGWTFGPKPGQEEVLAGDTPGEPSGLLSRIVVEREALTLDLRPLAASDALNLHEVHIEASYSLRNDGDDVGSDLVFIATRSVYMPATTNEARLTDNFALTLDETRVAGHFQLGSQGTDDLPPRPSLPRFTPPLNVGGAPILYAPWWRLKPDDVPYSTPTGTYRMTVPIAHGSHKLQVRYAATASAVSLLSSGARYWQIAYMLSSGDKWADGRELDVTVDLPPGWDVTTNPVLGGDGAVVRGTFAGAPADALAFTAQGRTTDSFPAVVVVGLVAFTVALGVLARRLGLRHGHLRWPTVVLSLLASTLWVTSLLLSAGSVQPKNQAAWTLVQTREFWTVACAPVLWIGAQALFIWVGARQGASRMASESRNTSDSG